jgi:septum formation protein
MIVLSSGSATRRKLLSQTGLYFKTAKPPVDESVIKEALKKAGASAAQVADNLAESKANSVAMILPGAYIIGADQMLECEGAWFDKPADRDGARRHLESLRGKSHDLITAAVIAYEGRIIWRHTDIARMTMRDFSDAFLDTYMAKAGDGIVQSVGAYEMEGMGSQLFEKIEGDYFSILGLPLIPLMGALREAGALPK